MIAVGIALSLMFVFVAGRAEGADTKPTPAKICIALAGDSTVTDNAGWAEGFKACLAPDVQCVNFAKGGRSSGSFVAEGSWKKVLALKPDYVLIQFGHNDQPGHGPQRETDPKTTYRANVERYVDDARDAGIMPVLVTSLSRRQWGADGKIHSTLQPYADAVLAIAHEKHVPVIDLHARSIELYERLGKEEMLKLSPRKNADPSNKNADTASAANADYDGTHLNSAGSRIVGGIVAEEVAKAVPALASYIVPPKNAATKAAASN